MRLGSTHHRAPTVSFREALVRSLAPDGGLYMPVALPRFDEAQLESWRDLSFSDLAVRLAQGLIGDEFPADVIERLVREALNFPVPTKPVEGRHSVLELFHGPTLAFKDVGARFLARFFGYVLADRDEQATVLVATSGDTGSAVAQGFYQVPNVRVVVLYPAGKVSAFQESQMATLGGNVTAVRLAGDFDECQRLVKQAFLDERLTQRRLASANSINVGRLLPQSFYYVASYLAVRRRPGDRVVFSVPSGNLGNLTAGLLAASFGLPIAQFVAATNANVAFTDFLGTGAYSARPSIPTVSSAMDVGNPSNIQRVAERYASFDELRQHVSALSIDERSTRDCIRRVYERAGYMLDPHGAVGYAAAERFGAAHPGDDPIVTLATAHPAKFGRVIKEELGFEPPLPDERYRGWQSRPILAVDMPGGPYDVFRDFLLSLEPVN